MKRPAFQFYPADWRKDAALQSCSVAARGLWMDMMCIAHECEPYGHLTVNGKAMTCAQIARLVGLGERECGKLLKELQDAGVSSVAEDGSIFSRRMVRDEDLRQRRADAGKAGSEFGILGAEHGRKGGRPRKDRGDEKPPLKPSPSSSSSSSTSDTPPLPPKGDYDDEWEDPIPKFDIAEQAKTIVAEYPRKQKVAVSLQIVAKDLKDGHSFEQILAGTKACADAIRTAPSGALNRYVPSAEAFFRDKRWQDDPATMIRPPETAGTNGHGAPAKGNGDGKSVVVGGRVFKA